MRLVLSVVILLMLSSCGYRLSGGALNLPDNASVLYIEMFENQTMQPYLENIITTQVTRRLLLLPEITLVENVDEAEAIVSGRVLSYGVESSAFDDENKVTQFRAIMKMEAEFQRKSDGRTLWRGTLIRSQFFYADPDLNRQDDLERIAQSLLAGRLAEDLSSRLTETF